MEIPFTLAQSQYSALKPATQPDQGGEFNQILAGLSDFASTINRGETLSKQAISGDVDPHVLVQALTQSELAVQTAVAVRNKVVEAYQEILRMPV